MMAQIHVLPQETPQRNCWDLGVCFTAGLAPNVPNILSSHCWLLLETDSLIRGLWCDSVQLLHTFMWLQSDSPWHLLFIDISRSFLKELL